MTVSKALRRGFLALAIVVLVFPGSPVAAPVVVRFTEGLTHGFLQLRTVEGNLIASGDLVQTARGAKVTSRMVFRFIDGSLFDETVVFTQQRVFALQTYHLIQRGPAFVDDTEVSLQALSGKYTVKTRSHKDGRADTIEGTLKLPSDVYNGMVIVAVKNLAKGAGTTVHLIAFTPKPLLVELEVKPIGDQKMMVGGLSKTATHYVFKPHPGMWLELFAKLFGRMPADYHVWILAEDAPSFARFEGPLDPAGAVWRIELVSPQWPE